MKLLLKLILGQMLGVADQKMEFESPALERIETNLVFFITP